MDPGSDFSDVDQAVETLPVLAADGSHDGGGRGDGQSEQDKPGEETYLDEATFAEVVQDGGPDLLPLIDQLTGVAHFEGGEGGGQVVAAEEEDVGGEMQRCVEEGVEADKATEADQEGDLRREAAKRGDGKRGEQDVESPVSGEVGDVVNGVGVQDERAVANDLQQIREGRQQGDVQQSFDDEDGALGHSFRCGSGLVYRVISRVAG